MESQLLSVLVAGIGAPLSVMNLGRWRAAKQDGMAREKLPKTQAILEPFSPAGDGRHFCRIHVSL
jgi:hypothetical protein